MTHYITQEGRDMLAEGAKKLARRALASLKQSKGTDAAKAQAAAGTHSIRQSLRGAPGGSERPSAVNPTVRDYQTRAARSEGATSKTTDAISKKKPGTVAAKADWTRPRRVAAKAKSMTER